MAVLHLQFDVDSEVHPELHAMLSSIGSSLSQAERLRQLASTGLVWERLRLQAYDRMDVPDLGTGSAAARESSGSVPDLLAADSVRAVLRDDARTARRADAADFVDLSDTVDLTHLDIPGPDDGDDGRSGDHVASHDVVNEENMDGLVQIAAAHLQPRGDMPELLPLHEIRSVVQEPPVLTEVIGAAELPDIGAVVAQGNEALPGAGQAGRGGTMPGGSQIHELAPARKTATRSRLMRMKEKGLFKNE
ncbi:MULTISPECIES: hypothetical protein [unclassified Roseateles]|uniref:hypothetical protein n=1 Tax=unclassified Roseateles TaxID=2626991 RepID=UPI0006FE104D|nr:MULTISPECIES: hypothetical protein [unclassified Roseateles]KQW46327.1 hypothetical protein ASC81_07915 [Pelomonas sp. Root405]KRA73377.1 hypothetical protein ASD88_07915 [Pelomonas sp. Root662]